MENDIPRGSILVWESNKLRIVKPEDGRGYVVSADLNTEMIPQYCVDTFFSVGDQDRCHIKKKLREHLNPTVLSKGDPAIRQFPPEFLATLMLLDITP